MFTFYNPLYELKDQFYFKDCNKYTCQVYHFMKNSDYHNLNIFDTITYDKCDKHSDVH